MNRSLVFSFFARDVTAGRTMTKLGRTAQIQGGMLDGLGAAIGRYAKRAALAAGVVGIAAAGQILRVGMAYQDSLNVFQAVSHASVTQMSAVGAEAKRLGADMSLPATSAADAAGAMTELAKGGLSVKASMSAALGTLRLATAAQVDGAQAAQIEANALNQFGLAGKYATNVADYLANTANAASGEITDMAEALAYVGPIARSTGIGLADTSTAIGLLAKNGVLGSMAGTSLRGMLTSLAAPSKKAIGALKALGIEAYTSSGKFVGLRKITQELAAARARLTPQAFSHATADAFNKRNLSAVNILAQSGAKSWDRMAAAVTRAGGAQQVAAAKMKGLHGALQGLRSQLETVAITIYQRVSPGIESVVRNLATNGVPAVQRFASVWGSKLGPVLTTVGHFIADTLWPAIVKFETSIGGSLVAAFKYLVGAIRPNLDGLKTLGRVLLTLATVTAVVFAVQFKVQMLVVSRALGAVIVAAGWVGKAFHALANFFTGPFVRAIGSMVSVFVKAVQYLADTGLTTIGVFVHGAAKAFGWLPLGIGGKLKEAAGKFDDFRSYANGQLNGLASDASGLGLKIGNNLGLSLFASVTNAMSGLRSALGGGPVGTASNGRGDAPAHGYRPVQKSSVPGNGSRGYVAPVSTGTGGYTPATSAAAKTAKTLTHITAHQARLLGQGLLHGFHGASQHVLSQLTLGLQDKFNAAATRIANGLKKWAAKVKTARDHMLADIKAKKDMAASIRDALVGGADLSGAFSQDANGNTVLGNIGTFLSGKLSELRTFAADLFKLRKAGLSAGLLAMIANLGPTQGIQIANQIMSGVAGSIGSLNATQAGITAAGQAAGNVVAGATYDKKIEADRKVWREQVAEARKHTRLLTALIHAVLESATTPEGLAKALRKLKREFGTDLGIA